MSRTPRSCVLAAVAVVAVSGCSSSSTPDSAASARPTPVTRLNAEALSIPRGAFCTRLPQAAVDDAVAGRAGQGQSWRNGDRAQVEDGARRVDDAVQEYGCRWSGGQSVARAWVFARAVTTEQARAVIAKTATRSSCTSETGPGFGTPSQRQTCTLPDGSTRVRLAGLFGDSWLSCEVADDAGVSTAAVSRRTDAWCVQVANALNRTR